MTKNLTYLIILHQFSKSTAIEILLEILFLLPKIQKIFNFSIKISNYLKNTSKILLPTQFFKISSGYYQLLRLFQHRPERLGAKIVSHQFPKFKNPATNPTFQNPPPTPLQKGIAENSFASIFKISKIPLRNEYPKFFAVFWLLYSFQHRPKKGRA